MLVSSVHKLHLSKYRTQKWRQRSLYRIHVHVVDCWIQSTISAASPFWIHGQMKTAMTEKKQINKNDNDKTAI